MYKKTGYAFDICGVIAIVLIVFFMACENEEIKHQLINPAIIFSCATIIAAFLNQETIEGAKRYLLENDYSRLCADQTYDLKTGLTVSVKPLEISEYFQNGGMIELTFKNGSKEKLAYRPDDRCGDKVFTGEKDDLIDFNKIESTLIEKSVFSMYKIMHKNKTVREGAILLLKTSGQKY